MIATCGNTHLDRVLFSHPQTILIYGAEGSGKTNFVLSTLALSKSAKGIYISTEGSNYVERAYQLSLLNEDRLLFAEAFDCPHLLALLASIPAIGRVDILAIDSINYHYRSEATNVESLRVYATILTLLKEYASQGTIVIATAQVREVEELEPAGMQFLYPWADVVIRIERRESLGLRNLVVEKPCRLQASFRIVDSGIEWL